MSKSALKHNQNMQQQGAMGKITSIARRGLGTPASPVNPVPQHLLGGVNTPNNIDTTADPIELQKAQVAEASGLNRLTQGPLGGLGAQTPFANKSPLKLAEVSSKDFSEYGGTYSKGELPDNMEWDSDNDGISDKQESLEDMTESLSKLGVAAVNAIQKKKADKDKKNLAKNMLESNNDLI